MEKFIRYELAFEGEPQGVGLFTGLSDTGLSYDAQNKLEALFCNLKNPFWTDGSRTPFWDSDEPFWFWFREQVAEKFHDAIVQIDKAIRPYGWEVVARQMETDISDCVWCDADQAAFLSSQEYTPFGDWVEWR